jgi:hypothetical protein
MFRVMLSCTKHVVGVMEERKKKKKEISHSDHSSLIDFFLSFFFFFSKFTPNFQKRNWIYNASGFFLGSFLDV